MSILKIFELILYEKVVILFIKGLKIKNMTTIKFKRLNIEAYKPGKSNIRRLKKIIKLSANESALGVSTRV